MAKKSFTAKDVNPVVNVKDVTKEFEAPIATTVVEETEEEIDPVDEMIEEEYEEFPPVEEELIENLPPEVPSVPPVEEELIENLPPEVPSVPPVEEEEVDAPILGDETPAVKDYDIQYYDPMVNEDVLPISIHQMVTRNAARMNRTEPVDEVFAATSINVSIWDSSIRNFNGVMRSIDVVDFIRNVSSDFIFVEVDTDSVKEKLLNEIGINCNRTPRITVKG